MKNNTRSRVDEHSLTQAAGKMALRAPLVGLGGAAGTIAGGGTGAAAGAVLGPPGAAIGFAVGCIAGFTTGCIGGNKAANAIERSSAAPA